MLIGPQVAFVDDIKAQIQPLEDAVNELHTGSIYFDASPEKSNFPTSPLESVEILFLDLLYYNHFDVELSAQWVTKIIPEKSKYTLVIWSKDTDDVGQLLSLLDEINMTPTAHYTWQKTDFNLMEDNFKSKMEGLIRDVSYRDHIAQESFIGEVVDIEDEAVLVNCRISSDPVVFQVRRFDKDVLGNISNVKIGTYLMINVYTKPGARMIDVFELKRDMTKEFEVQDFFKGLEGGAFFIEG